MDHTQDASKNAGAIIERAGRHWQLARQSLCLNNGSRHPAKPAGVLGADILVKVGDPPPSDPSELSFLSVDTRTPHVPDYAGKDGGKTAHYMRRWVATTGEKGRWSETVSATIGA